MEKTVLIEKDNSPCNRVVWVSFKLGEFELGIFSIYALNEHTDRINLWQCLSSLPNIPWILAVDFNMVERA